MGCCNGAVNAKYSRQYDGVSAQDEEDGGVDHRHTHGRGGKCCALPAKALRSIRSLGACPREFWMLMLLKFANSFCYFSMSINLTLYLSNEFAYDDVGAGGLYGTFGVITSVYGLLTGVIIDKLGVRWSLVLGGVLCTVGYAMLAVCTQRWALMTSLMFCVPCGLSLGIPVMTIGVKRYTSDENRSVGYGMFYTVMNIGAMLCGPFTDAMASVVPARVVVVAGVWTITPLRVVFAAAAAVTFVYTAVAMVMREVSNAGVQGGGVRRVRPVSKSVCAIVASTLCDRVFYQLVLFSFVMVGARTIFRHLDATFPKYLQREIGPSVSYGSVYSIEPALIIVLVPLATALLGHFDIYKTIIVGTAMTSVSVFVLAVAHASYASAVAFVVLLSIGEAVYSPRIYEYTMLLAPNGQEGIYSMLASVPLFAVKFAVGLMSGALLDTYCAADAAHRNCAYMWFIIGMISLSTPILLIVMWPCVYSSGVRKRISTTSHDCKDAMALCDVYGDHEEKGAHVVRDACGTDIDTSCTASIPMQTLPDAEPHAIHNGERQGHGDNSKFSLFEKNDDGAYDTGGLDYASD